MKEHFSLILLYWITFSLSVFLAHILFISLSLSLSVARCPSSRSSVLSFGHTRFERVSHFSSAWFCFLIYAMYPWVEQIRTHDLFLFAPRSRLFTHPIDRRYVRHFGQLCSHSCPIDKLTRKHTHPLTHYNNNGNYTVDINQIWVLWIARCFKIAADAIEIRMRASGNFLQRHLPRDWIWLFICVVVVVFVF